jgi:hypothetical protein
MIFEEQKRKIKAFLMKLLTKQKCFKNGATTLSITTLSRTTLK